jgi:hypothetical protein
MLYIKVGAKQNDHFEYVPEYLHSPGNVRVKADSSMDSLVIIQYTEKTRACGLHRYNQHNRNLDNVHMSGNRNFVVRQRRYRSFVRGFDHCTDKPG